MKLRKQLNKLERVKSLLSSLLRKFLILRHLELRMARNMQPS
nr:MAG TPA: hypothetical protein [Caudoviricetes sp.]